MAIDNRQKRASAVSTITFARIPGVDNTSLDQAQRQASIWSYAGILVDVPGATVVILTGLTIGTALGILTLLSTDWVEVGGETSVIWTEVPNGTIGVWTEENTGAAGTWTEVTT